MGGFLLLCLAGLVLLGLAGIALQLVVAVLWRPLGAVLGFAGSLVIAVCALVLAVVIGSTVLVGGIGPLLAVIAVGWVASRMVAGARRGR